MKRLIVFLALVALLLPVSSFAAPDGEVIIIATGGFRFANINSTGPQLLEALADGTAAIRIISSTDGAGTDPNGSRRNWPAGVFGVLDFNLRSNIPRPFITQSDKADSCYVTLLTATEVILTWTND